MTDEHDRGVMGCYGDPLVQTPNIDALAQEGVLFENAYTTCPLCVPARLSFISGKYSSRSGAWCNQSMLPSDDYPCLPEILAPAGYHSYLIGKMHFDKSRRYGFQTIGDFRTNNYSKSGKTRRSQHGDRSPRKNSWKSRTSDFAVSDNSRTLDHDREVTETSIKFLAEQKPEDGPFFLTVGYLSPHFPLTIPQEYYDRYKGKVPPPIIPEGFTLPENYEQIKRTFGFVNVEPELIQYGRDLYWGLVDWLDDEFGKLMDALKSSAFADNTIVIFTADHGENKGDHTQWWKNNMYEHAAGIPLIVSYPQRWAGGQRRKGACSLVDLTQTIAEMAGASTPNDWDGDSLVPWLDDPQYDWKDFALSEYFAHFTVSGFVMARHGRYKYVYHSRVDEEIGPYRELYDLEHDPGEFVNLADTPEHKETVDKLHRMMLKELGETPEEIETRTLQAYATGYPAK